MAVGQTTILEHLQQHVEHVRMSLLHLVHQHDRVGFATHSLGQVAALLVADVARRCADQTRDRMFLHELGHVDADHRLFGVEEEFGQCLAQLGLTHTGRTEEEEGTARPVRVGQPGARPAHGIGHCHYRLMLADDTCVQHVFHAQQFVPLAFEHLRHRNAGPLGDHLGDLLIGHLVAQQLVFLLAVLVDHFQAALEVWDDAVLQLGHARQVALAPRRLEVGLGLLDLLLDLRGALDLGFFRLPDLLQIRIFLLQLGDIVLKLGQALLGGLVVLLLQRLALDLQLDQPAVETIQLFRLESISMRMRLAASSIRSMALSGS